MNVILFNKYKKNSIYYKDKNSDYFMCPMDDIELTTNIDYDLSIYLYCFLCSYKKTVGLTTYEQLQKDYPDITL